MDWVPCGISGPLTGGTSPPVRSKRLNYVLILLHSVAFAAFDALRQHSEIVTPNGYMAMTPMDKSILVGTTVALVASLAINHAVHGFGCWGLQPGGFTSAMIYAVQILAAVIGVLLLLVALSRNAVPFDTVRLSAIAFFVLASIATCIVFGWRAHTSIHGQGPENLLAYSTVAPTTYLVGRYRHARYNIGNAAQDDQPIASSDVGEISRLSDNPYAPPQSRA